MVDIHPTHTPSQIARMESEAIQEEKDMELVLS